MESTLIAGFLLTSSILCLEPNERGREAARYTALATYRQTGLDKIIEPNVQYLEKKYIPEYLKSFGVGATFIYRASIDHKIEFIWRF